MKKKITFITGAMGRGGAERVISIIGKHFVQKGWNVDIVMVLHSNVEYELPNDINIIDLSSERGIKKGFLTTLGKIRRYIKVEKPDIVVCFMAQICLLFGLATLGLKQRVIMSERIDPNSAKRNIIYRMLLNFFYAHANCLVLQTKRAKNYFNKKVQMNSRIIGNPVNVECCHIENDRHRIVTAGRMTQQKNQSMLIDAFSKVQKHHQNYSLTIYGDGPLRENLQEKIISLNLSGNVELPGNVLHLHEEMKDAEMFVLPSNFEGLSNALLEAMMMGIPVIATNCAGCDEVIDNYCNGILIEVRNEDDLVKSIEFLIDNPEERERMALKGQEYVQMFKVENIINQWEEAIDSCF